MTAAQRFIGSLHANSALPSVARIRVELYGSLALTGKGHATDRALLLALSGFSPETIDPDQADKTVESIRSRRCIRLADSREIAFVEERDIIWRTRERLPAHSNGMMFVATNGVDEDVARSVYYSVGGGAIFEEAASSELSQTPESHIPFAFRSAAELLSLAQTAGLSIAELAFANEVALRPAEAVHDGLRRIARTMSECIERGVRQSGVLPGGLKVRRRAHSVHRELVARRERASSDSLDTLDWVNLWALAVNEENASGGRVVTAPTNGAAGIVPAVLRYHESCVPGAAWASSADFLLVAGAIGSLFKENASNSGAEVGCQGEIGVACSMAAAGLCAVLGGTNEQVENAAEIGMEHNLGLTCDPVGGLVQVPCIERNAMGVTKAIHAARLALLGDGAHRVSLDQVIETMRRTGIDMSERYKETSLGGLAVNVVEC